MTKSMLKAKGMPKRFLSETVSTVAYILNKYPIKKMLHKTPYEAWTRLKPIVGHFKVFA